MTRFTILSVLFFCVSFSVSAQDQWYQETTPAKTVLVGGGPTFFGLSAKAGIFIRRNILLGINAELHELLSSRREAGLFGRKYLNRNRLSFFAQGAVAYGRFQVWDLNLDDPNTESPELYRSVKLNGSLGGEIRLSKMVSIEGEAGYGRILGANWWAPSIKSAINIRLK